DVVVVISAEEREDETYRTKVHKKKPEKEIKHEAAWSWQAIFNLAYQKEHGSWYEGRGIFNSSQIRNAAFQALADNIF
ncbi:unnamed protein product, partial [Amoebophrya sp. A25]